MAANTFHNYVDACLKVVIILWAIGLQIFTLVFASAWAALPGAGGVTASWKPSGMRVSEVARLIGRSVDTIKRWEAQGLITPPRDDKGQRQFGQADVDACLRLAQLAMVAQHDSVRLSLLVGLIPEQLTLLQDTSHLTNIIGGQ